MVSSGVRRSRGRRSTRDVTSLGGAELSGEARFAPSRTEFHGQTRFRLHAGV